MPKLNFTVRALDAIKPPTQGRVEYWDSSVNGSFGLRVSYSGQKTWITMYRVNGRLRRHTIGSYDRLPLGDARAIAKEVLYRASKGEDPAAEKSTKRSAETFKDLAREYLERHAKVNKKSWQEDQRLLEKDILPQWRLLKARDIRRRDVMALLDHHVARGAPVLANRILALVRKIFNFGLQRDLVEFNPCQAIHRPTDEKGRQGQRVLTFEEIRKVWLATENLDPMMAAIFKLRILTGQRGGEIRFMEWSEIDFERGWWTIPGSKTKNKLQHRVPITPQMRTILEEMRSFQRPSPFVFPCRTDRSRPVQSIQKAFQRLRAASGVADFVDRDFRRTAASHITGQLGIPRLVVSKILNHVEQGITRVYDRHSYDKEKKEALERWDRLLHDIVTIKCYKMSVLPIKIETRLG